MRMNIRKNGISPVVSTVLLILMVVVLISMIFVWGRSFFENRTEGSEKPVGELCGSVYFTVNVINEDGYVLEITNRGNIDISGFEIKQYLGGNSEVLDVDESVLVGESIEWTFGGYNAASEKIEIFPVLNESSSAKTFTCYSDPEFIVI